MSLCKHPVRYVRIYVGSGGYEYCSWCGAIKTPGGKFERPLRDIKKKEKK